MAEAQQWLQADPHREQGEYVVIVHPAQSELDLEAAEQVDAGIDAWLDALLEVLSVRDAARVAAKATGQSRDMLYARALARKGS